LDFSSPSAHIILGAKGRYPKEDKGIIPPSVFSIKLMSVVFYSGDNPFPLRGADISNTIIELLTITRWGKLDYLIIDMPPGIGTTTLDIIRLLNRIEFLIVSTNSAVVLETVNKFIAILQELGIPILGVIENMRLIHCQELTSDSTSLRALSQKEFNIKFLGAIDFDSTLELSLGSPANILATNFYAQLFTAISKSNILVKS
jgi:ATP-binding protein involved in chromosome partitioning